MRVCKSIWSATVAAFSLTALAVPAQAQDQASETGSRFSRDKFDRGRDVRQTLKYYGTCVAGYKSDKIEAYLLDPTQETWEPVVYSPNSTTRCAMMDMSAGYREYSGTVSEGWYLRRFKDGPPAAFKAAEQLPPSQEDALGRMAGLEGSDLQYVVMNEFARCVAATAPVQIDTFLRSSVESKEERAAVGQLAPYLGPCSFEGQNLKLDYESLRSMLAFALAKRAAHLVNGSN